MIKDQPWPLWTQVLSLVLAAGSSLTLLIFPHVIGREISSADHAILPLFLMADGAAFAFGLGFVFNTALLRILTSPIVVWPVLGVTFCAMVFY